MKKITTAIGSCVLVLLLTVSTVFAHVETTGLKATFLGRDFEETVLFHTDSLRTYVHGEDLAAVLGASYAFDSNTNVVTITKANRTIQMTVGEKAAVVNGERQTLDAGARLLVHQVILPVRFVAESLGYQVEWHPDIEHINVK